MCRWARVDGVRVASPRHRRTPIDARRRRAMCGNPTRRRRRSRPRRPGTEAPKRAPSTFFWRAPFKNLSGRPTSSASLRRVSLPSLSVRGDRGSTNSVGQLSLRYAPAGTPSRRPQGARRAAKSSSSEKKTNPPGTRAATPAWLTSSTWPRTCCEGPRRSTGSLISRSCPFSRAATRTRTWPSYEATRGSELLRTRFIEH